MKQFLIPEDLGNLLMGYLAKRPYEEVFQLIPKFQALEEHVCACDHPAPAIIQPELPL